MPRYRVIAVSGLPHDGQIREQGAIVELPRHVAADSIVRDFVQEVDEGGNPILAPLQHDFEHFRPHEQVTLLDARLVEAYARVEILESQIALARAASVVVSAPAASVDQE